MTPQTVSPDLARATWAVLEPIHVLTYFSPETRAGFAEIGLDTLPLNYLGSRAAPMGTVDAGTVTATFYSFNPDLIAHFIPKVWSVASPELILRTRLEVADRALRRVLGEDTVTSAEMREAADLARTAALEAARHPHGRPLFAGHAGLDWPEQPHLVLWHAATLLREFRGDGHVATLVAADVPPVEALASHCATGAYPASDVRRARAWSEEVWDAATKRLRERGLVTTDPDGEATVTEAGRAFRDDLEARTDRLAAPAFSVLGANGNTRLTELVTPMAETIRASGSLPGSPAR